MIFEFKIPNLDNLESRLQKRSIEDETVILETTDYFFCDGTKRKEFQLTNSSIPYGVSLTPFPNADPALDGNVLKTAIIWESRGYSGKLDVFRQLGIRGECRPDTQTRTKTFDGMEIESPRHFGFINIANSNDLKIQTHQFDCGDDKPCSDALVVFYRTDKFILSTTGNFNKFRITGRTTMEEGTDFSSKEYLLDFMTITITEAGIDIRGVDETRFFSASIKLNTIQSTENPVKVIEISSIVLSEDFQHDVSGLCGNFDKDANNDGEPSLSVLPAENYFFICGAAAFIDTDDISSFDAGAVDDRLCSISYQLNQCPGVRLRSLGPSLMKR
jgi:hypothetical protein